MNTKFRLSVARALLAAVSLLPPRVAGADVAPKWTDAQLAGFSNVILRGRVARVGVALDARVGSPYTYVSLDVAEVLKGSIRERRVILKQLGGELGSTTLQIAGQPTFTEGEDVVAFLEVRPRDGTLTTTAVWQGKFTIVQGANGDVAMRQDSGGPSRGIFGDEVRSLPSWLSDLRREIGAAPATPTGAIEIAPAEAAQATTVVTRSTTVVATWQAASQAGQAVRVDMAAPGQLNLADGGERQLRQAAEFWNDTGLVTFAAGGLRSPGCFTAREPDGRVAVGVDGCGELSPSGGTIAVSGRWIREDGGRTGLTGGRIVGAGVITNRGEMASRLLARSSCFEKLATHELGHVLGLSHSPDGSGVMGAFLQCDGGFGTILSPAGGDSSNLARGLTWSGASIAMRPSLIPLQPTADAAAPAVIQRVSVASDGAQSDGWSYHPTVSGDDRYVAFDSTAANLVPGDTNSVSDIFVYDRFTRLTTRESLGPGGVEANGPSLRPSISAGGRFVAFRSSATNLVPGVTGSQIYVRDRQLGMTIIASVSSGGIPANGDSDSPSMSADGRYLSFASSATNLVAGDTNGAGDVFTHDFVSGATTREGLALDGTQAMNGSAYPSISSDGRYLAYWSSVNGMGVILVRDRVSGQTSVESVDTDGHPLGGFTSSMNADGRLLAFFGIGATGLNRDLYVRDRQARQTIHVFSGYGHSSSPRLSADGRFVTFSYAGFGGSPTNVLVYDQVSRQVSDLGRMSTYYGTLEQPAIGTNSVVFSSEYPLIAQDTNGTIDVYVALLGQTGAPAAPLNLGFSLAGSTLTLTWTAPTTGDPPTAYVVEAGTSSAGTNIANFSTDSTSTSFAATVSGGGTYYVRVRAANAFGTSAPSNEVVVTLAALPGAPIGLTASVAGSSVTLTWSPPAAGVVTTYVVEAGSAPGTSDLANFATNSTATTLTANSVGPGTYFVRVKAANVGGVGPPSNETVLIVGSICTTPGAPSNLAAAISGSTVALTWTAGAGATSYRLQVGSGSGQSEILVSDLGSSATSLTAVNVAAGSYFVRLQSLNMCGASGVSNEALIVVR